MVDMKNLDDDPEVAFAQYVKHFEEQYLIALQRDHQGENNYEISMNYMVGVLAAASALGLDMLDDWEVPAPGDHYVTFNRFRLAAKFYMQRSEIRQKTKGTTFTVGLNDEQKSRVYMYLDKIRSIFEQSSLEQPKREQLLMLLGSLRKEIELDRTRLSRVADTVRRVAGLTADVEETAGRPIFKYIKAIFGVFDEAKEDEIKRLPGAKQNKELPAPPKQLEPPRTSSDSLDDEIPF